ncbi:MAG: hypothetical protein K6D96_01695 [Acetatifactor sp.]|nr:hypothetical protein [Acetatifactor sp.]
MSDTYYDYREVKVKIAHRLLNMDGWTVYGYYPDNSDAYTDYYDPAYWDGIAIKNGFKLVIDKPFEKADKTEKRTINGSGISAETMQKLKKLEAMTVERGATPAEEETAKQKIQALKEKDAVEVETITEFYPGHKANPPRCNWHIEKDGIILDKGTGLLKFASVPDISDMGRSWERESWQEFNNLSKSEWIEKYINDQVWKWGENERERATKTAESVYNHEVEIYDLLDKFNALIARFNNVCGGMVGNAGEDGYIYEEQIITEYKTELKPQENAGSIKEGQCFILKSDFSGGCFRGYVYRIKKSFVGSDGVQRYTGVRLGKGYKKELTGLANSANSFSLWNIEKFNKWVETGAIAFCDLVEVKTPYEVKKVVKKVVKNETPKTEKEDVKQEPENMTAENENTNSETMTADAATPEKENINDFASDSFESLARAFATGKQAPKKPRKETKTETADETPEEPETITEEPEKEPEPIGYHGDAETKFTDEEINVLINGGQVQRFEPYNRHVNYFCTKYTESNNAFIVYYISGATLEPGYNPSYNGFIVNGRYYSNMEPIAEKLKIDLNIELLKRIPNSDAARANFEKTDFTEWDQKEINGWMQYDRKRAAQELFYDNKKPSINLFSDEILPGRIIKYLSDPEKAVNELCDQYMQYSAVKIVKYWIEYDKTLEEYNAILNDKTRDEHKIKAITGKIHDEKTVKIELSNGHAVKVETRAISGLKYSGTISAWYVVAADRQYLNKNEYGRDDDININEIISVSHGQKLLYKKSA